MNQEFTPPSATRAGPRLAALATLFAIAACGGGGGGGAAPPPPPPDPTVSAMAINPVAFDARDLMVTIEGTDLAQGLQVNSAQCTGVTQSTASPNASGASVAYYRCAATAAATTVTVAAALSKDGTVLKSATFEIGAPTTIAAALAGAGAVAPTDNLTGDGAVAGTAKYGQQMTLTVTGTNVNQGLLIPVTPACTGLTLSTTPPLVSSASTAFYRCRVAALSLNQLTVEFASAPGVDAIFPPRFDVPIPEVTLSMAAVDPSNASKTTLGQVVITLSPSLAPITANNFLDYVNSGFYDGTIFHNVQALPAPPLLEAGRFGPTTGTPPPVQRTASTPNAPEVGGAASFLQWTVAMTLNTAPENGPARFFINMADNSLAGASAVFGSVTAGQTLAQTMGTSCGGQAQCLPLPNFTIDSAVQTR